MNIIVDVRMVNKELHGIARYAYELINNMSSYGDLKFFLLTNDEEASRALFSDKKNISYLKMKTGFLSPKEQFELPAVLNKFGRDYIFHSPSFSSSPFIKLKSIMTIHDLNHIRYPQFYTPLHRYYYEFVVKPAARKCGNIITVSNFSKSELLQWLKCDDDKIKVTYNGVDERFERITSEQALNAVREKYQLPGNFLLYVGNQKPHKNVDTLIKALSGVKGDLPLVINGRINDSLSKLMKEYKVENRVKFIGFVDDEDLPALYSMASIFVFPSLYEGFGLPPLEAMACGCPVIVSDASSLPEVVEDAGITFDPLNYIMLAEKINYLIENSEKTAALAGRGLEQAGKFNWKKTAEQTYEIYKQTAEGDRK